MDRPRSKGRPLSPSVLAFGAEGPDRIQRVSWLLRANRIHRPDLGNTGEFTKAFRGGSCTRDADRPQLSRWERAVDIPSYVVIRRYEDLLNLEETSLTAVADLIFQEIRHGRGRSALARPIIERSRLDEILEKLLGDCSVTGREWDTLSTAVINVRASDVRRHIPAVTHRLIAELFVSDGHEWLLRNAATHRLLLHDASAAGIVAACAEANSDPTNQIFSEPMSVLEAARGRTAARQVLTSIIRPVNEQARQAAWWCASEKLSRGHFSSADRRMLTTEAAALLTEEDLIPVRIAASDLLRHEHNTDRAIRTAMERALSRDGIFNSVYTAGRISRAHQPLIDHITQAAAAGIPSHQPGDDLMLSYLIEEALLHPYHSRRTVAARMLAATPYGTRAGAAMTAELRRPSRYGDTVLAPQLIHALMPLGDHTSRMIVQRLATDPVIPPVVRSTALWSVSHIPSACGSPKSFWDNIVSSLSTKFGTDNARAVVYALGISGQQRLLSLVRKDPALPHAARIAAYWWLKQPQFT